MASRAASRSSAPSSRPGAPRRANTANARLAQLGRSLVEGLKALARWAAGAVLALFGAALVVALLFYSPEDPSFNTVTARVASNPLGTLGSHVADLVLQSVGWPGLVLALVPFIAGLRLLQRQAFAARRALLAVPLAVLLLAAGVGMLGLAGAPAPAGAGGVVGTLAGWSADALAEQPWASGIPVAIILAVLAVPLGLLLAGWGSGLGRADFEPLMALLRGRADADEEEDDESPLILSRPESGSDVRDADAAEQPGPRVVAPAAAPSARPKARQAALDLGDAGILPPLDLLKPPPARPTARIDEAALAQNARLLEGVLEDFGIKGSIGEVRPGPVVTMYELEPGPGIKATRIVGLSDDIARSMSALSARVAVVPGRTVIGIELPNAAREMVSLSELIASPAFEARGLALPLVLGKDIAGDPVVVDLAPMPHLLIAGTTGSGKSVGLNAMIVSLLYRLTPAECRLIMIDPKMLELKMYDGIPHLLAPVVTEPAKAIRALKWAVEQMEERYRQLSAINVRNVASFNQKVREAKASSRPFIRSVQTGWDPDTETPIIEDEVLDYEPLPLIVVVVDELADLMMTAGKEVEFLIQRLAQKARAAGIHLIMATQRPSVDVITGVIKANLPTRISFQVSSKIDSRTILGEQGAEQLLGKGDMLYMALGKPILRIHGPFVSDDEVEAVADHWRRQGTPAYLDAVTEEPSGTDWEPGLPLPPTGEDEEADSYTRAVAAVASAQKASTSYIQRVLRIGYNNAARLIEQMEEEGLVSRPDHAGRREVLIDEHGNRR